MMAKGQLKSGFFSSVHVLGVRMHCSELQDCYPPDGPKYGPVKNVCCSTRGDVSSMAKYNAIPHCEAFSYLHQKFPIKCCVKSCSRSHAQGMQLVNTVDKAVP